jgi:hypothetical protein
MTNLLPVCSDSLLRMRLPLPVGQGQAPDSGLAEYFGQSSQPSPLSRLDGRAMGLMGMWERLIREWIGATGTIRGVRKFRMRRFSVAGSVIVVRGPVVAVDPDLGPGHGQRELCRRLWHHRWARRGRRTATPSTCCG